jgi:hypothetical protein
VPPADAQKPCDGERGNHQQQPFCPDLSAIMAQTASHGGADRPLLRGICVVVKGDRPNRGHSRGQNRDASRDPDLDRRKPPVAIGTVAEFPRRPDVRVLSETIPLFFIGRNGCRLWIAREAEGRTGGIFLFKRSALRFAERNSAPIGCATMFLADRFELDVENRGNPLAAWLDAALRSVAGLIPAYPPPISIRRKIFNEERR